MTPHEIVTIPGARYLRAELDAIASCELADALAAWPRLSRPLALQLAAYLRSEMEDGGMLSVGKAREAGQRLAHERQEARRVLRAIERQVPPRRAYADELAAFQAEQHRAARADRARAARRRPQQSVDVVDTRSARDRAIDRAVAVIHNHKEQA